MGIDCAFGWPDDFVEFVSRHAMGARSTSRATTGSTGVGGSHTARPIGRCCVALDAAHSRWRRINWGDRNALRGPSLTRWPTGSA